MGAAPKRFFKGVVTSTIAIAYTVPSGKISIIKAITLCNTSSAAVTFNMTMAGMQIIFEHTIKPKDTITIPFLDQVMVAADLILVQSNTSSSSLHAYISGKEIDA